MTARILVAGVPELATRRLGERLRAEYFSVSLCVGETATFERLQAWRPDLVVLECPQGDDGLAVCRRLRGEPASRHLPLLLLLPGAVDPAFRLRGLELGADEVLGQPLEADLLLVRMQALLRIRRIRDEWRIRSPDLPALGPSAESEAPNPVAGARVLVIDDDEAAAAEVQDGLARDGVTTGRAATAAQAATLCAAMAFDLVVLNLALLTDDPRQVAAALRAAAATRQVPLLLLAPPRLRELLLRCVALGGDEWMAWPPADANAMAELRARIRNRLRQKLRHDRLRADLAYAFEMALTDPLTGCYNRRYLGRKLQASLSAAPAKGVSLLLLDVDRFKAVNERFGYASGDLALIAVAALLREQVRALDSVARCGGEEFAVLMPGCTLQEAIHSAERLRDIIEGQSIAVESGETLRLTVSIGVTSHADLPDTLPVTPERLLHLAHRALQAAFAQGGNTVASEADVAAPDIGAAAAVAAAE